MIAVRYINPPRWAVARFGDDLGRVFLDTGPEFDAELTKAIDRINEVQRISQEAALAKSLPATAKNRALFDEFSGDTLNRRKEPVDIEVTYKGDRLPLTGAIVTGFDPNGEDGPAYEFEMFADDWIDRLEALPLADVDAGTYEYTVANVLASWSGPRREIVKPVPAEYGGFRTPGEITRKDLRMWFNLGLLMEAAFCSIGWSFDCEHFKFGDGANVYGYLSPEDWFSYEDKRTEWFVELEITEPITLPPFERFLPWNEVYDPFDIYDNPNSILPTFDQYGYPPIAEPAELLIEVDMVVEFPASGTDVAPDVAIIIDKNNNGTSGLFDFGVFRANRPNNLTLEIQYRVSDPDMTGGDRYSVSVLGTEEYIIKSANMRWRPNPRNYGDDNIIPVAKLIDPEITALDLFTSLAHLMNGKVITDVASRTVILRPPYPYQTAEDDRTVEGFYVDNRPPIDYRDRTVVDGTRWESNDTERNRYRLFKFADSDDERVDASGVPDRYNRRVDLGSGIVDTTDIENVLFGPTIARRVDGSVIGGDGATLPGLFDNLDGEISTDVGYRVGVWYGQIDQNGPGSSFVFEGQTIALIPFLSQIGGSVPTTGTRIPLTFDGDGRNLYTLFYQRETESDDDGITYEILLTGGIDTYEQITFRRPLLIRNQPADIIVRPIAVKGYRWGSREPLTVTAKILLCL